MKVEYISLLVAALLVGPAMGRLGAGVGRTIADSGAASSAEPRAAGGPSGSTVSAQAGVAGIAAFAKFPLEVQGELRDGIAFAQHLQTVPGADFHAVMTPGLPPFLRAGDEAVRPLQRLAGAAIHRSLAESLDAVVEQFGEGAALEAALQDGSLLRRVVQELPARSKDGGLGMAKAIGVPADAAAIRRGGVRLVPEAPAALWDHFFDWLEAERDRLRVAVPVNAKEAAWNERRAVRAFGALRLGSLRSYLSATFSPNYGKTGEFGVPMSKLDDALLQWKALPYDEPSETVRALMETNLELLERSTSDLRARFVEHRALWAGTQRELPELVDQMDAFSRATLTHIQSARARTAITKRETVEIVREYLRTDYMLNSATVEMKPFAPEAASKFPEHFPWVTASAQYWRYAQVPRWAEIGVLPLEIPIGLKQADAGVATGGQYAGHDLSHLGRILRNQNLESELLRALYARSKDEVDLTDEARDAIHRQIGLGYWEGMPQVQFAKRTDVPIDTRRRFIGWVLDYAVERKYDKTARDARAALESMASEAP